MRVPALTGIRGVAAMSVMLYHIPQQPIFEPFRMMLFDRAYLCVDLFFVLSGFVMAIGYRDIVADGLSIGGYRAFLRQRLARVYPLHLVVTLAFLGRALLNLSGDGGQPVTGLDIVANLLMMQSWGLPTVALAGNSWSVSTELIAYLLFPLLAIGAASRFGVVLAVAAVAMLAWVSLSGIGVEGPMDVVQRGSLLPVLRCVGGFALGLLVQRVADLPRLARWFGSDAAFGIVCATMAIVLSIPGSDLAVVVLLPLLILCCYHGGRAVRLLLANRVSMRLGIISYSLYLWHPLFRDVAARVLRGMHDRGILWADGLLYAMLIAGTIVACELSYRLFEVGGRRLLQRRRTPASGAAVAVGAAA